MVDVIEPFSVVKVDDKMRSRAPHAIPHHKMIVALLGHSRANSFDRRGVGDRDFFLSGGTWGPQARRRLEEGVLAHAVLPNQRSKPERPASRLTEWRYAAGADSPFAGPSSE